MEEEVVKKGPRSDEGTLFYRLNVGSRLNNSAPCARANEDVLPLGEARVYRECSPGAGRDSLPPGLAIAWFDRAGRATLRGVAQPHGTGRRCFSRGEGSGKWVPARTLAHPGARAPFRALLGAIPSISAGTRQRFWKTSKNQSHLAGVGAAARGSIRNGKGKTAKTLGYFSRPPRLIYKLQRLRGKLGPRKSIPQPGFGFWRAEPGCEGGKSLKSSKKIPLQLPNGHRTGAVFDVPGVGVWLLDCFNFLAAGQSWAKGKGARDSLVREVLPAGEPQTRGPKASALPVAGNCQKFPASWFSPLFFRPAHRPRARPWDGSRIRCTSSSQIRRRGGSSNSSSKCSPWLLGWRLAGDVVAIVRVCRRQNSKDSRRDLVRPIAEQISDRLAQIVGARTGRAA